MMPLMCIKTLPSTKPQPKVLTLSALPQLSVFSKWINVSCRISKPTEMSHNRSMWQCSIEVSQQHHSVTIVSPTHFHVLSSSLLFHDAWTPSIMNFPSLLGPRSCVHMGGIWLPVQALSNSSVLCPFAVEVFFFCLTYGAQSTASHNPNHVGHIGIQGGPEASQPPFCSYSVSTDEFLFSQVSNVRAWHHKLE